MTAGGSRPAVFLDRDGVLNALVEREGALVSPLRAADFRVCEGAAEAVSRLRRAGLPVFVVTNQPDLARGGLARHEHDRILGALRASFAPDDVGVCPHDDADGCSCRKPAAGLLQDIARRHDVDLSRSVIVGDSWKDVEAGRRAGCRTILLRRPYNRSASADLVVATLAEAVAHILAPESGIQAMNFSERYCRLAADIALGLPAERLEAMVEALVALRDVGGRIFFLGVGGGAGHASHAVNDFRKIAGFECYTPTDNVSELTARINDDGWETCYSRWLEGSRIGARDAVFVFSVGGGNAEKGVSLNLVRALETAKRAGARVFGVVGRDGGYTAQVADVAIVVPTVDPELVTPFTEAFQAVVWHLVVAHPRLRAAAMKWESLGR